MPTFSPPPSLLFKLATRLTPSDCGSDTLKTFCHRVMPTTKTWNAFSDFEVVKRDYRAFPFTLISNYLFLNCINILKMPRKKLISLQDRNRQLDRTASCSLRAHQVYSTRCEKALFLVLMLYSEASGFMGSSLCPATAPLNFVGCKCRSSFCFGNIWEKVKKSKICEFFGWEMEKTSNEDNSKTLTSIFATSWEKSKKQWLPNVEGQLHTKGLSDLNMSE